MGTWNIDAAMHVVFSRDPAGDYAVEGLTGFQSAAVSLAAAADPVPRGGVAMVPYANPAGPFDTSGLITIKFYVCAPGREEELVQFERDTQNKYYSFMAPAGWRYGGLCTVRSSMPEVSQPFAEIHSVAARDRPEAVALDEKTKPEPQDILDMYEACAAFSVKGQGRMLWLTPKSP